MAVGARALQREERGGVAHVHDVGAGRVLAQVGEVGGTVRGVDADHHALGRQAVDDDVVDDAALRMEQQRVLGAAVAQAADVVRGGRAGRRRARRRRAARSRPCG
jgi:hypothetical protein